MPTHWPPSRRGVPKFADTWVVVYDPDGTLTPGQTRIESMQVISDLKYGAYLDGTMFRAQGAGTHYLVYEYQFWYCPPDVARILLDSTRNHPAFAG